MNIFKSDGWWWRIPYLYLCTVHQLGCFSSNCRWGVWLVFRLVAQEWPRNFYWLAVHPTALSQSAFVNCCPHPAPLPFWQLYQLHTGTAAPILTPFPSDSFTGFGQELLPPSCPPPPFSFRQLYWLETGAAAPAPPLPASDRSCWPHPAPLPFRQLCQLQTRIALTPYAPPSTHALTLVLAYTLLFRWPVPAKVWHLARHR